MVAVKNPLLEMECSEEAAAYIGVLERQLLGMTVQELRYRALLEVLTGDDWSDIAADLEAGEIEKIAVEQLVKKGVDRRKARRVVGERAKASAANAVVTASQSEG